MKVRDAVARIQELQRKMAVAADNATAASHRYQGHMTLYNVAVMTNDPALIEQERLTLHSALDGILDAGLEIGICQREINELSRRSDLEDD